MQINLHMCEQFEPSCLLPPCTKARKQGCIYKSAHVNRNLKKPPKMLKYSEQVLPVATMSSCSPMGVVVQFFMTPCPTTLLAVTDTV